MLKRAILISLMVPLFVVGLASAKPKDDVGNIVIQEPKVEICHFDNNVKKPWGPKLSEVAASSVDGVGNGDHYLEHTGPVPTSEAEAQALKDQGTKWGDIIPPVPGKHSGLNWTATGQAIYNNDCQFPDPVCDSVVATKLSRDDFQFDVNYTSWNGTLVDFDYDFGDGSLLTTTNNPQLHEYQAVGTYVVKVTVNFELPAKKDKDPEVVSSVCQTSVTVDDEDDGEPVTPSDSDDEEAEVTTTAQVDVPKAGGVNAGGGSATASLVALVGSVASFAYGFFRLRKFGL